MALILCPECGKRVSNQAEACPECGYPIQQMLTSEEPFTSTIQATNKENCVSNEMAQKDRIFVIALSMISIVLPLIFSRQIGYTISLALLALPCVLFILLILFQSKKKDMYAVLVLTLGAVLRFLVRYVLYREPLYIISGLFNLIMFFSLVVIYWLSVTSIINNKVIPIIATVAYATYGVFVLLIASTNGRYEFLQQFVFIVSEVTMCVCCCIMICDGMKYRIAKKRVDNSSKGNHPYVQDAPSIGFSVLSFCFPVVGLVLFCVWHDSLPQRAKSAGIGGLSGFIIGILFAVITYGILLT